VELSSFESLVKSDHNQSSDGMSFAAITLGHRCLGGRNLGPETQLSHIISNIIINYNFLLRHYETLRGRAGARWRKSSPVITLDAEQEEKCSPTGSRSNFLRLLIPSSVRSTMAVAFCAEGGERGKKEKSRTGLNGQNDELSRQPRRVRLKINSQI
jgi:hypothetical protein